MDRDRFVVKPGSTISLHKDFDPALVLFECLERRTETKIFREARST